MRASREGVLLWFFMVMILLIGTPGFAEFLKAPVSVKRERGSLVSTVSGKIRWSADWTIEPITVEGAPAVKIRRRAAGFTFPS
jgi:hypothetical protein